MNHIDQIRSIIRELHGVESRHIESVPLKEAVRGRVVWEGMVEVFELINHPSALRLYAWLSRMEKGNRQYVTVLHAGSIDSPRTAVLGPIIRDYKIGEAT